MNDHLATPSSVFEVETPLIDEPTRLVLAVQARQVEFEDRDLGVSYQELAGILGLTIDPETVMQKLDLKYPGVPQNSYPVADVKEVFWELCDGEIIVIPDIFRADFTPPVARKAYIQKSPSPLLPEEDDAHTEQEPSITPALPLVRLKPALIQKFAQELMAQTPKAPSVEAMLNPSQQTAVQNRATSVFVKYLPQQSFSLLATGAELEELLKNAAQFCVNRRITDGNTLLNLVCKSYQQFAIKVLLSYDQKKHFPANYMDLYRDIQVANIDRTIQQGGNSLAPVRQDLISVLVSVERRLKNRLYTEAELALYNEFINDENVWKTFLIRSEQEATRRSIVEKLAQK